MSLATLRRERPEKPRAAAGLVAFSVWLRRCAGSIRRHEAAGRAAFHRVPLLRALCCHARGRSPSSLPPFPPRAHVRVMHSECNFALRRCATMPACTMPPRAMIRVRRALFSASVLPGLLGVPLISMARCGAVAATRGWGGGGGRAFVLIEVRHWRASRPRVAPRHDALVARSRGSKVPRSKVPRRKAVARGNVITRLWRSSRMDDVLGGGGSWRATRRGPGPASRVSMGVSARGSPTARGP